MDRSEMEFTEPLEFLAFFGGTLFAVAPGIWLTYRCANWKTPASYFPERKDPIAFQLMRIFCGLMFATLVFIAIMAALSILFVFVWLLIDGIKWIAM